jgi:TRIAD3 protein (E3 ubiquitin-protein ligase RNF216)
MQCPDGHLFCANCISQYAATQLGAHNPSLVCMDSSDCNLAFPESELRRVLTPKLMELHSRLVAQKVVADAGLESLEEYPFCDWKCVIDVPVETASLFRCGNGEGGCGVVSCRKCKKKDHLPKTCQGANKWYIPCHSY